jgi:hypothetical protein
MSSLKLIGPTQYKRLLDAIAYYERAGYKYVDVPWAVSKKAILLTRPAHIKGEPMSYTVNHSRADKWLDRVAGSNLYPVASAEQSFIQMKMDDKYFSGKLVTISPCFRNEPVIDELHQPYFMKVELINWVESAWQKDAREQMDKMIADARLLFEEQLWVDVIHNTDPDPIGVVAYDLVTTHSKIELGSYGIRQHPDVGTWLYGTGLAEPRFSIALDKEPQIEAFF